LGLYVMMGILETLYRLPARIARLREGSDELAPRSSSPDL
jgi:hypothetical protein